MKKYIIGFLIGVSLTLPLTVFAEDISKIGKKIAAEYTVILNDEELPVKAVAFDGASYAPVRAISEALGLNVAFKGSQVILTTKEGDRNMLNQEEITYKDLRAVKIDGNTYFSWKDYNQKYSAESFAIGYDSKQKLFFYAELVEPDSTEIKNRYMEFSQDEPGAFIAYKGDSYINVKYYRDPAELVGS